MAVECSLRSVTPDHNPVVVVAARAPDGDAGEDLDAQRPDFRDERGAIADLGIPGMAGSCGRGGGLLEELPAGRAALVDDHHAGTGRGGGFGGRKAAGSGADHQHVPAAVFDRLRYRAEIGKCFGADIGPLRLALDAHAVGDGRHTGPLADATVHDGDAVVAGPHAAEDTVPLAGRIGGKTVNSGAGEHGRDADAGIDLARDAVDEQHRPGLGRIGGRHRGAVTSGREAERETLDQRLHGDVLLGRQRQPRRPRLPGTEAHVVEQGF